MTLADAPVPRIDISNLQLTGQLGGGGQGKVAAVNGLLINGQWPAALKTYSSALNRHVDTAVLERIVAFPRQLNEEDSGWLHATTAWPMVIAEDRGMVRGFLMRTIPEAYYFGFRTAPGGAIRKPAETAYLLNSDAYVASTGLVVSDRDRLALLASVASVLSRLHALGVTVGDLSPKNLLFSLHPVTSCFMIDCDAMCVRGDNVLHQVQTPDWEVPPGEATATPAADAYKFALLAIRLFARDQSSYDRAPLSALSAGLEQLAHASLQDDPAQRPSPSAWIPELTAASGIISETPATVTAPAAPPHMFSVPIETVGTTAVAAPASRPPSHPAPRPRARRNIAAVIGTLASIAVVAVVVILGLHSSASHGASSSTQTGTGTPSTTSAQNEAAQLNRLLNASAASRQSLAAAVQDVDNCSNVSSAISAISAVAGQRATEYDQASAASTGALPNGSELKSELLSALSNSVSADHDFLQWAQQNENCQGTAPVNAAYSSGITASANAVTAKEAFVRLWNPIAANDGFPTRQEGGI
jgi:hypothetical protein